MDGKRGLSRPSELRAQRLGVALDSAKAKPGARLRDGKPFRLGRRGLGAAKIPGRRALLAMGCSLPVPVRRPVPRWRVRRGLCFSLVRHRTFSFTMGLFLRVSIRIQASVPVVLGLMAHI